jgi:hypothetical protein
MTSEGLAVLLGTLLSLFFAYVPWIKDKFDKLDSKWKPLLNAGLLLVLAAILVGLDCANVTNYFGCSQAGVIQALQVWFFAVVANQATYAVAVRQVKQG